MMSSMGKWRSRQEQLIREKVDHERDLGRTITLNFIVLLILQLLLLIYVSNFLAIRMLDGDRWNTFFEDFYPRTTFWLFAITGVTLLYPLFHAISMFVPTTPVQTDESIYFTFTRTFGIIMM